MKREASSKPKSNLTLPAANRDHIQGPIDAPFALVEYGDFECPYCGEAYPIVKAIRERLADQLCFAFRNFPLTNMHLHAEHAAEAAEAAGAQGRFWEMHDILFENQDALEDDDLARYASTLGLDVSRLIHQVLAGAHNARIQEDLRGGARSGVNGTPTFFINGIPYDGEPDVEWMLPLLTRGIPRD